MPAVVLALLVQTFALIGLSTVAASAAPGDPLGLEPGDLVIADTGHDQVVVVPADGGPDRVLADGLDNPGAVVVTPAGDVVVALPDAEDIVRIPADGSAPEVLNTTRAPATTLALDGHGNILFGGNTWGGIGRVSLSGGAVENFVYDSGVPRWYLGLDVASDGSIVAAETGVEADSDRVVRFDSDGTGRTVIPELSYDPAAPAVPKPRGVRGLDVTPDGRVLLGDTWSGVVWESDGVGGATSWPGFPATVVVEDDASGVVYVAAAGADTVHKVSADRTSTLLVVTDAPLLNPGGLAVVPVPPTEVGDVFGAANRRVYEINEDGSQSLVASGFDPIGGVAVDGDGDLLLATDGGDVIELAGDGSGRRTTIATGLGALTAIAIGAGDEIYVGRSDGRLYEVAPGGGVTELGAFGAARAIAVGPDGAVYFADTNAVRRLDAGASPSVAALTARALAWDPTRGLLAAESHDLLAVDPSTGGVSGVIGQNDSIEAVAVDAVGRIYVSADRIDRESATVPGAWDTISGSPVTEIATYVPRPAFTAAAPPVTGNVGAAYDGYTFTATDPGGLGVELTVYDGTLPPGLTLDEDTGELTGEPTTAGAYPFRVQAANPGRAIVSDPITITIGKRIQTIDAFAGAPSMVQLGDTYSPTGTGGGSGNPVTFSIRADSTGVCTYSAGTGLVTFQTRNALCTIVADQAGNATYEPAASVEHTIMVDKVSQSLTITSSAPVDAVVGDTYAPVATATSGLPVVFEIGGLSASVCSVDGDGLITFEHVGSCMFIAKQPGDSTYWAAGWRTQTVTVGPATFAFTSDAPDPGEIGATYQPTINAPFAYFDLDPSTEPGVCTVDDDLTGHVTFLLPGTCVLRADTWGDPDFVNSQITQSITVLLPAQSISFTSTPPSAARPGDTYPVSATATSGGAVSFSIAPASSGVCSLVAGVVHLDQPGSCIVRADQPGTPSHRAAPTVTQTIVVGARDGSLAFTSTPPSQPVVGATYTVTATAAGGGPVTFQGTPGVCSVTGATVTFLHTGSCVVQAQSTGGGGYGAATATQTVVVQRAATALGVVVERDVIIATVSVVAPGGGTPTGQVVFSDHGVEIGTGELVVDGAGDVVATLTGALATGESHSVTATYAGSDDHLGSSSPAVSRADPAITAELTSRKPVSKAGWYRTPVTISFTCQIGTAPLVGGCLDPITLNKNRRGNSPLSFGIVAEDGGAAEVDVTVRIDKRKPAVKVRGIKRAIRTDEPGKLRCVARDKLSGVDTCTIRTRVVGDRVRYRAVALDLAGNRKVVRGWYPLG
ncbi:Ig-like domain repeat protein [Nocardioides caricicola]|uniref:Ig-like domain repeat protein n=1 Tax=Nocardioides caricicola TaxID=634770 RepID=A0ABW0MWL9_9ACTN